MGNKLMGQVEAVAKTDTMQSFFGQAIRRKKGNPNKMEKQIK